MKSLKPFHFILIILLCNSLFSCKKTHEEPNNPIVNPDDPKNPYKPDPNKTFFINFKNNPSENIDEISLSKSNKNAYLVIIDSHDKWNATTDCDWINLASWVGEKSKMGLVIGVDENLYIPREATITFVSGTESHSIKVKQKGAPRINFIVGETKFSMVYVEGGSFWLGDSDMSGSRWGHSAMLDSYYMCETEVTNSLWLEIIKDLPYKKYSDTQSLEDIEDEYENLNLPVSYVTWNEINDEFLPKLKAKLNYNFRLPTEAEWEYAALGGINRNEFEFSGSNDLQEVAWYSHNCSGKQNVATLKPNSLGVYDMTGNVSEWCNNWHSEIYETKPELVTMPNGDMFETTINPKGPISGVKKVVRGGDYTAGSIWTYDLNIKYRFAIDPTGFQGCWGGSGHPEEPTCFFANNTGFRFILPL